MKIRGRYHLAIVPLFLGLGLANSALVYHLEQNEVLWGLEQRASGTAAAVAGFWPLLEAEGVTATRLQALDRRLGGVSVTRLTQADGQWRAQSLHAAEGVPAPPPPDAATLSRLMQGKLAFHLIRGPQADLISGYAPVDPDAGVAGGIVATSERSDARASARTALLSRLAWLMALVLVAGLLVAEAMTRLARSELGGLTRAARALIGGRHDHRWEPGRIRELNDLGGTLGTMTSLLADGSHRLRRRFLQTDVLPDISELGRYHRARVERRESQAIGDLPLAHRRVGDAPPEDFLGTRKGSKGWHLVIGRCQPPPGRPSLLERSVHAEAAREFLLGVASARPDGPSWPQALAVFPCSQLTVLFFPANGKAPTGWRLDGRRGTPAAFSVASPRDVLGTSSDGSLAIARAYVRQFSQRPLPQLADEIAGLLGGREGGLLVVCEIPSPHTPERSPAHDRA
jgi:hypothetical protein